MIIKFDRFDKLNKASGSYLDAYVEFEDNGKIEKTPVFPVTKDELSKFAKVMGFDIGDVCVVMKRNVFSTILQKIPTIMKDLLQHADRFESCEEDILINWNCIKWYYGSTLFRSFDSFVAELKQQFSAENYYLIELGEDPDHYTTLGVFEKSILIRWVGKEINLDAFA